MTNYVKYPHTAIFTGLMGCRKSHFVLDFIEKEYKESVYGKTKRRYTMR